MLPRTPPSNSSSFYVSFNNREDLLRQIEDQQRLSEAYSLLSEQRPIEHYVLEESSIVAAPGPSTSTQPQRPPQRRRSLYALNGERFLGTVEPSIKGKHPVIRYCIPGSPLCYSFQHLRTNSTYEVYRCTGCRKSNTNTMIAVIGDQFIGDPCMLDHNCIPAKSVQDKVERMVIKECRRIKEDKKCAGLSSRVAWQDLEDFIEEFGSEDPEEKDAMLHCFHRYGFAARQRTFRRAIMHLADPKCTMDNIPQVQAVFPDGSRFLHFQTPDMHMYYSSNTIQMAQEQGLWALVADGVHDLQPDATNKRGQLYTVHGVCNNTIDVPLLYAITTSKTELTYQLIFSQLKSELQQRGIPGDLRIVLDFEKASINAARKVFPNACVQGCGFHLAVCWNRKRDYFGLRKYLLGPQKDRNVCRWWDTIRGLIFLPPRLHRKVPALFRPSLPRTHQAYQKCEEFLEYLRTTWYEGFFKDMWCKWDVMEIRTTNLAEAFHRLLGCLLQSKYPPMAKLLRRLRSCNTNARGHLLNMDRRRTDGRKLKKRDKLRRIKIEREMRRYKRYFSQRIPCIRTVTISTYCRRMSQFVTNKSR